LFKELELFKE
jgi:hypothetical protein